MTFKERIVFFVASWKVWQRYAVTFVFIVLIMSCWWMLSYRGMIHQLQQIRRNNRETTREPIIESVPITEKLNSDSKTFFSVTSAHQVITLLVSSTSKENVRVENYIASPLQKQDWYSTFEIAMKLQGELQNIINFLEHIQVHHNISIKKCEMMSLSEDLVHCHCTLYTRLSNQ